MDQRLGLGNEVRELKLGSTFNTPKPRTSFHTLKYDFKPASVDLSKTATLDVSSNNQVTVTMPHLDSSGVPKTVFKGNQRNYTKECVLIIDKVTGEITLEKLHHNVQVKKTRSETNHKSSSNFPSHQSSANNASGSGCGSGGVGVVGVGAVAGVASGSNSGNASTSSSAQVLAVAATSSNASERPNYPQNNTQRVSNKTRVSTGIRKNALGSFVQRHSPIQGSPSYPHHRSPQQAPAWNANNGQSTLPSIPLIGMDDDIMPMTKPSANSGNISSASSALDLPPQFNYHSNKPSKSSPKLNTPSNNPISQSSHSANNTNNSLHNSSSLQTSSTLQQSRQSSSGHHHRNNNYHHHQHHQTSSASITALPKDSLSEIGVLSSSDSSDSSDSDSNSNSNSSDSDSNSNSDDDDDDDDDNRNMNQQPQHSNVIRNPLQPVNGTGASLPALLLDEDLRLSSNSSDSDDD